MPGTVLVASELVAAGVLQPKMQTLRLVQRDPGVVLTIAGRNVK